MTVATAPKATTVENRVVTRPEESPSKGFDKVFACLREQCLTGGPVGSVAAIRLCRAQD
jgi:hypothetical protein